MGLVEEKQVPIKSDCEQMVAGNGEEKHAGRPWVQGVRQGKSEKRQILCLDASVVLVRGHSGSIALTPA